MLRIEATCETPKGNDGAIALRTGQRESTAALLVLAAQHAASKPRGPTRCRPHGGAPAAATNADAAGANCGWRDARAGRQFQGRPGGRPTNGAASACDASWAAGLKVLME